MSVNNLVNEVFMGKREKKPKSEHFLENEN